MTTLTPYQALIKARNLIRKPQGWTKNASKRVRSNGVTAYCASGACDQVARSGGIRAMMNALLIDTIRPVKSTGVLFTTIPNYNDYALTQRKQAVAWFQRAIRLAKKRGLSTA